MTVAGELMSDILQQVKKWDTHGRTQCETEQQRFSAVELNTFNSTHTVYSE